MSHDSIRDRAADFIWRNARLIDRRRFAFHFGDGSSEAVLRALRAYQNSDGGFGNALEPDKRDPHSQPVDCQIALEILDEIDAVNDPMVIQMCEWLQSIATPEGGVPFALPTTKQYPHAGWWAVDDNPPASINPTAAIVGLLLKHGVSHPWVERATAYCYDAIAASDSTWYHDIMPMITFLQHAPARTRNETELERIVQRLREPGAIIMETEAEGYAHFPLDWAPTPDSYLRRLFSDEIIATHLEALQARQQPDGGWPINWEPISPTVELEWRGVRTLEALRTLRAYGMEPTG
jgi:hypothetical protein